MKTDVRDFVRHVHAAPVPDQWDDIRSRVPRSDVITESLTGSSVLHRVIAASVAFAVFGAVVLAWSSFRSEGGPATGGSTAPSVVQHTPTSLSSTTYALSHPASEIAAAGGYIWVAEESTDQIQKVDPSTGKIVATIPTIGDPNWLAGGDGVVWVGIYGTEIGAAVGIDTTTNDTVLTVHGVFGPLVQTEEGLWGFELRTPNPNWMVLLDPRTGSVIRHVEVPTQPFEVAASGRSVWLLDMQAGTVSVISEGGSLRTVTDRPAGSWLAASTSGVYLSAWRGGSANGQNGPATSAFASLDGQVQPFGEIYNFRPMVVADNHVWFVAGPHDGDISGLCSMRTTDGIVDSCADIPVDLEGARDPVAFDPTTNTIWAVAYDTPKLYAVDAG
jgi:hypothetical protein